MKALSWLGGGGVRLIDEELTETMAITTERSIRGLLAEQGTTTLDLVPGDAAS